MKRTPFVTRGRLAAFIAAAGLFALPAAALAQTQLPPPQQYGQAEARQDRIEELEGQLRDATAENERLQYQLLQANREITRLRGIVGELAAANQSLGQSETPPSTDGAAPPQTQQSTPPPAQQRSEGGAGLNAAQERATGTLGTIPATQAPPQRAASTEPLAEPGPLYSRARELLNNGRLAEAEEAFAQFLQAYPSAETAPDARYWYAYTLLARNNYQSAATNFVEYLRRYPTGVRAPDAQVRLGMAFAGLGDRRRACAAWADIPTRYPRAPQRVRDDAQREMRASQCAA